MPFTVTHGDSQTKASGKRRQFASGSVRDSRQGKGRYDLIPALAMRRLAELYERGAEHYGDNNWKKGQPLSSYTDSLMRHTNNLTAGERSEDHLASIMWNAAAYMWTLEEIEAGRLPADLDDRNPPDPKYISTKVRR